MTGGLIQLVTSGKQDVSLTYNPQITFFKKVYRRHTNFSLEIKEIYTDQQADFENTISFSLNNADLIHHCFIQIDLPQLSFDDSSITNDNYITWKINYIQRLNNDINRWNTLYINLKNFASIELILYQQLQILFLSDNITLISIQDYVIRFNNTYKNQLNTYSTLIDISLYNSINMSAYLLSINKLLKFFDGFCILSRKQTKEEFANTYKEKYKYIANISEDINIKVPYEIYDKYSTMNYLDIFKKIYNTYQYKTMSNYVDSYIFFYNLSDIFIPIDV